MEPEFREARLLNIVATSEARASISRSWSTGYVPKAQGKSGSRRHLIRLFACAFRNFCRSRPPLACYHFTQGKNR
jgi:hypothetical protein